VNESHPKPGPAATGDVRAENWAALEGLRIEIYLNDHLVDRGLVDAVTFDGSILWLKQNGVTGRRLVERMAGMYVRISGFDGNRAPP
jgi:hypothetical protein